MIKVDHSLRRQRLAARDALRNAGTLAFKPVSSAQWTDVSVSRRGAIRVRIQHDDIAGVTPEMIQWWFENMAGTTTWNGVDFTGPEVLYYHLWHHRDHIRITPLTDAPDGTPSTGFRVGALSRIDEQFNDYRDRIHQVMRTTRLDSTEFTFDILGPAHIPAGYIIHRYAPVDGGVSFYAETVIDVRVPILGPVLNWLVRPFLFSRATADHWIRHNIEETGRTADILPAIHAAAHAPART
ncbi:hypothetical protein [Gordonia sp. NB41Y]|uniref:hypothetical protein n=1 Tax=Gordonia sp. NB41Y TaxID=875808 RepID=UPI0002BDC339|nr:hypothetical protein [Gordonia sp. NB41Y]EMP13441.1 hypothetical protein ISGA_2040 [Gordonia sp. NB41Y]WLP89887.1 hypothetical protein Q9K23_20465 [Gordonia sp. NB41Y]